MFSRSISSTSSVIARPAARTSSRGSVRSPSPQVPSVSIFASSRRSWDAHPAAPTGVAGNTVNSFSTTAPHPSRPPTRPSTRDVDNELCAPRLINLAASAKIHRAGGVFVHLPHEPSASAYGPRERLRPTHAPRSVHEATYRPPIDVQGTPTLRQAAVCDHSQVRARAREASCGLAEVGLDGFLTISRR